MNKCPSELFIIEDLTKKMNFAVLFNLFFIMAELKKSLQEQYIKETLVMGIAAVIMKRINYLMLCCQTYSR